MHSSLWEDRGLIRTVKKKGICNNLIQAGLKDGGRRDESLFGNGAGGGRGCDPVRINFRWSKTNQEQKGHTKSLAAS